MATIEFTTEELASEEWRPVVGWEGRYEVSNLGRVKSLRNNHGVERDYVMRGSVTKGYLAVKLSDGTTRRFARVHSTVAAAFIGPRQIGMDVNHIDGVKLNNRSSNLEYLTEGDNTRHAARLGLMPVGDRNGSRLHPESRERGDCHYLKRRPECVRRGVAHPRARLTESDVLAIRARLDAGEYQEVIAADFGIGQSQVGRIHRRESWSHLS